MSDLAARVLERARAAGAPVTANLAAQAAEYLALLARWNERINLTGFSLSPPDDAAIDRLIVEPLAAAQFVAPTDRTVVDVGSGGGSPALPLKMARPDLSFLLVESKSRKVAFLREAARTLHLDRVEAEATRLETLVARPTRQAAADVVTIRAVRIDAAFLDVLKTLLRPGGRVFVFTGADNSSTAWPSAAEVHDLVPSRRSRLIVLV